MLSGRVGVLSVRSIVPCLEGILKLVICKHGRVVRHEEKGINLILIAFVIWGNVNPLDPIVTIVIRRPFWPYSEYPI